MRRKDLSDSPNRESDHLRNLAVRAAVSHEPHDAVVPFLVLAARGRGLSSLQLTSCTINHALAAPAEFHDVNDTNALAVEAADEADLVGCDVRRVGRSADAASVGPSPLFSRRPVAEAISSIMTNEGVDSARTDDKRRW